MSSEDSVPNNGGLDGLRRLVGGRREFGGDGAYRGREDGGVSRSQSALIRKHGAASGAAACRKGSCWRGSEEDTGSGDGRGSVGLDHLHGDRAGGLASYRSLLTGAGKQFNCVVRSGSKG